MAIDLGIPDIEGPTEIGRGGFGVVYKAHQTRFDRVVAVKVLEQAQLDEAGRQRFERECRALGALSGHPNVVNIYDSGFTPNNWPYLVLEYLPDGSLGDRIETEGPFEIDQGTELIIKIAGALETAHRSGVLHRDLKPENILLGAYGEPKLGDFGIARIQGSTMTATSTVLGSPAHAAPEIIEGKGASVQTDIYSLGSTLYVLLSGRLAFQRDTDESIIPVLARIATEPPPDLRPLGVPDAVWSVIERAMAKDPAARPATAQEFGRQLQQARDALGLPAVEMRVKGEPAARRPHTARPGRTTTTGTGTTAGTAATTGLTPPQATPTGATYTPQPTLGGAGTTTPPGSYTPGSYTPGSYTPGSYTPGSYTPQPGAGFTPPPGSYTPQPTPGPTPATAAKGGGTLWWVAAGVLAVAALVVGVVFVTTRGGSTPTPRPEALNGTTSTPTGKTPPKKSFNLASAVLEPSDVPGGKGWKVNADAANFSGFAFLQPCAKNIDTAKLAAQESTILEGTTPGGKEGRIFQAVGEFEDEDAATAYLADFAKASSCQQWTDSSGVAHDIVTQSIDNPSGDESALYEDIVTDSGKDFDQDIVLYRVGRFVGFVTNLTASPNEKSFSEELAGAGADKLKSAN